MLFLTVVILCALTGLYAAGAVVANRNSTTNYDKYVHRPWGEAIAKTRLGLG